MKLSILLFTLMGVSCAVAQSTYAVYCWDNQVVYTDTMKIVKSGNTNEVLLYEEIFYLDQSLNRNRFRYEANVTGSLTSEIKEISYQSDPTTAYSFFFVGGTCLCQKTNSVTIVGCVGGNETSGDNGQIFLSYNASYTVNNLKTVYSGSYLVQPSDTVKHIGVVEGISGYSKNSNSTYQETQTYSSTTTNFKLGVADQDFVVPASWNCPTEAQCQWANAAREVNVFRPRSN